MPSGMKCGRCAGRTGTRSKLVVCEGLVFAIRGSWRCHRSAENELRMGNAARPVLDDQMRLETERLAQPLNHPAGIAITHLLATLFIQSRTLVLPMSPSS